MFRPRRPRSLLTLTILFTAVAITFTALLLRRSGPDAEDTARHAQRRAQLAAQQAGDEMEAARHRPLPPPPPQMTEAEKAARVQGRRRRFLCDPDLWEPGTAKAVKDLARKYRDSRYYHPANLIATGEPVGARVMVERLSELRGHLDAACADLTKLTPEGKSRYDTWIASDREGLEQPGAPDLPETLQPANPKPEPGSAQEAVINFTNNRIAGIQQELDAAELWEDMARARSAGDDSKFAAEVLQQKVAFKNRIRRLYDLSTQWRNEWEQIKWQGFEHPRDALRLLTDLPELPPLPGSPRKAEARIQ